MTTGQEASGSLSRPRGTESLQRLLFTTSEAAKILGVSRSTLYLLLAEGQIESVKIGSLRRIPGDALDRYVRRLRQLGEITGNRRGR